MHSLRCFIVVLLCSYCSIGIAIDKGNIDDRQYEYVVLENQLKVILISDANADKAAASLDVKVGSSNDPKERQGLAHFLEHMLFLGTQKYPNAADYQAFIDGNAGSHNAYTSAEHTNYFFDIDANQFEPALDRFAQFFIAPLFDANYVDRERHAVHSEYQAKIKDDLRREYDVYRQLINPDHPYATFSVGSLKTLADRVDDRVRDDLLDFYQQHYSSDRMTLVVLGKETLAQLKAMVVKRFSQVPQRSSVVKVEPQPLFAEGILPFEVISQPVKNIRQMSMMFPLPSMQAYYQEKPLQYLASIIGHEGPGSLLAILKNKGWAEALSAGSHEAGAGNSSFMIRITLTQNGLDNRDKIRALVFYALQRINQQGIEQWRYAEEQQLSKIAFSFREKGRAITTVRTLADQLHDYPAKEVISAPYLYQRFDAQLIRSLLKKMTPQNLFVSTVFPEATTDKISTHYNVPYSTHKLASSLLRLPKSLKKQYRLPKKNVFIPSDISLFAVEKTLAKATTLPTTRPQITLWAKQDTHFSVPKANIAIRALSPQVSLSVRDAALNELLVAMINDQLNPNSYPALLAGLSYSLLANSRGVDIRLSGYHDKMDVLLNMVLQTVAKPRLDKRRFNNIKVELLRQFNNSQQETPFRQLFKQVPANLYAPYWTDKVLAEQLDTVNLRELKRFAKKWLNNVEMKALFYGNIDTALTEQWQNDVETLMAYSHKKQGKDKTLVKAKVLKLAAGSPSKTQSTTTQSIAVDHNDKAAFLYVQGRSDTLADQAKMSLVRQIIESSFYSQLRTEQQLGYIVFLTNMTIKDVPGSLFVVQSPNASLSTIQQAITEFITNSKSMIPDDLSIHQQSLTTKLLEKPQTLADQAGRYWDSILKDDKQFSYRQRLVQLINQTTANELREYYQHTLLNNQHLMWFTASHQNTSDTAVSASEAAEYYIYP